MAVVQHPNTPFGALNPQYSDDGHVKEEPATSQYLLRQVNYAVLFLLGSGK